MIFSQENHSLLFSSIIRILWIFYTKNSKKKTFLVHRIVANAFIKNPNALKEVNHKDENGQNDSIENLEWCSHLYNMRYGTRTERAIKHMIAKKGKRVVAKLKSGEIVEVFNTIADACRKYGCASTNVSKCCSGKIKSLLGMKWEYA